MQNVKQLNDVNKFPEILDLHEEALRLLDLGLTEEEIFVIFNDDGVESRLAKRAVSAALTHKFMG